MRAPSEAKVVAYARLVDNTLAKACFSVVGFPRAWYVIIVPIYLSLWSGSDCSLPKLIKLERTRDASLVERQLGETDAAFNPGEPSDEGAKQ